MQGVGDQVKISGAYCRYVAVATAVLHGLSRTAAPVEREEADLGPASVFDFRSYRFKVNSEIY